MTSFIHLFLFLLSVLLLYTFAFIALLVSFFYFFFILYPTLLHVQSFHTGHNVCQRKLISRVNLFTELQSEILLPCLFEAALFGSDLTMSAVWDQISTTVNGIVEIPVNQQERFWNHRDGRIQTFRDRSGSGNFSILISNVQRSDLGLYRCELFRESNCSLAYREISEYLIYNSLQRLSVCINMILKVS